MLLASSTRVSEVPAIQLDGVAAGNTVKVAEILVVQEGSIRAVVPRSFLGVCNEPTLGIVSLHLVDSIFVAPVAVLVLAIEVIVLTWMGNHCNFAKSDGTFLGKGTNFHVGNI